MVQTSNLRIESIKPMIPPALLCEELPLSDASSLFVQQSRNQVVDILNQQDDRLIIVVGPCSIHDPGAALEYAGRLKAVSDELAGDLRIVMRVYFEKPRTTVGWKGLINDPHLDGTYALNQGLHIGRKVLLDIVDMGLPAGCEFLDLISPQFTADLVTWGAIGARTTESQVHRELASGLSMPVGFKNGTDGSVQIAIDALRAAAHPHSFFSVTEHGLAAVVSTRGNLDTHVIHRGSNHGVNYGAKDTQNTLAQLRKAGLPGRLMIDASHGNSDKDFAKQPVAMHAVAQQVAGGETGIIGVMLESFLVGGRQDLVVGKPLTHGQSITDACMGWDMTVPVLHELAEAVRTRRARTGQPAPVAAGAR